MGQWLILGEGEIALVKLFCFMIGGQTCKVRIAMRTRTRITISSAFILVGLFLFARSIAIADDWMSYVNPRFGTTAEVPVEGFAANRPPDNGDGQSWASVDGKGTISIYGSFMVVADTFQGYREFTLNTAREDGVTITHSAGRDDWFAYSGTRGPDIVYMKALLSKDCAPPTAHHVYLKYPATQRKRYDPIVTRVAKSLRAGRGVDCN